jgi:hypothetical protein
MNNQFEIKKDIVLAEVLDRLLDKGIVIQGTLLVGIADIELIYINLQAVITSVETIKKYTQDTQEK